MLRFFTPNKQEKDAGGPPGRVSREAFRPFTLVQNFTYISLVVIFAGSILLSTIISHRARGVLLEKSEEYALLLASNLNHQIFLQFLIPTALQYGKIQLRHEAQYARMDKVVRGTLHGFNVDMVTIYGINDVISYSFNQALVGKEVIGGIEYNQAISGKASSKLEQRGPFWSIILGVPEESKLRTFAPLFAEETMARFSGEVLGVIEIVLDLSEDYATIFRFQIMIVGASASIMLVLFLILRLYVKRGEEILLKRAAERLKLEEQLSEAERLAALGEMTAGVSHEIRNPLGIIRSTAQLLKKRAEKDNQSGALTDVIIEEATRLNNIITDFLNFARPSSPNFKPCRVEEVLEKNLSYLGPRLVEGNYRVVRQFGPNLPQIFADPNLLYQCFLNILINAMQAMPEGGVITVDILADEENVTLSFTDQGPGVSDAAMKKIWNPFFTTKDRGTGLGLSVVRNIIDAHQGFVWIENAPGRGACLWIQMPVGKEHGNDFNS
ncbi:MAG: ATP-binding protein [Desulfatibacillaceae bacterium]|nr:ATP-binding protein [Desulfatibacillaceae bacterium]